MQAGFDKPLTREMRILFVSSNGVGMGHLTRLLAVARRFPGFVEPVFLTMSQALSVICQFGYHAEYLPSHQQTLSDVDDWNRWLAVEIPRVLDELSVHAVVFDGNLVYSGLADAVASRPACPLIWIRRGMWRSDQDNSACLDSGEAVDLIIEPDDVASELDTGLTAERRHEATIVNPIRLLDTDEVLPRVASCRTLGLDPAQRHVLIQLGSGNNSNVLELISSVVTELDETGVHPVIAEWITSDLHLDLWPQVPRLRCYPISRYFEAFDFAVSAAGYNSFNEIIGFAMPSILVPNLNRSMDNQRARAVFAHRHGAAIHLDLDDYSNLRSALCTMLDDRRRRAMKESCRCLAKPNGARRAAEIITARCVDGAGP